MLNIADTDLGVNGFPGDQADKQTHPGSSSQTNKPDSGSGQSPKIGLAFSEGAVTAAIECGYSPIPGRWKPGKFKDDAGNWQERELSDAKRPLQKGWQEFSDRTMTVEEQQAARKGRKPHLPQIHLAMGYNNVIAIDVDTNDPFIQKIVTDVIGRSPVSRVGGKGYADFFLVEGDMPKSEKWYGRKDDNSQSDAPIIEIMAHSTNVRIPPSYHPTAPGFVYRWVSDEHKIYNTAFDELPRITVDKLATLKDRLAGFLYKKPETERKPRKTVKKETLTEQNHKRYQALADKMLRSIMDDVAAQQKPGRDKAMKRAACILGVFVHHGYIKESTFMAEVESAAKANGFDKEPGGIEQAKKTAQFGLDKSENDELPELEDRPFSGGAEFKFKAFDDGWIAEANSDENVRAYEEAVRTEARTGDQQARAKADKGADTPPPPPGNEPEHGDGDDECPDALIFTEEWLALRFADKYRSRLRWMEEWSTWMEWTGTHWRRVKTLAVYELVRRLLRQVASRIDTSDASGKRFAAELNSAKKRAAVQTIARSDLRFSSVVEDWDADDWLLGTPGGIIDLRTGQNLGYLPQKHITRITTVAPVKGGCPTWLDFLNKVTKGDKELQAYLQRMCGYALTGSTREHSLTFIYGPGGNGKGTFLNVLIGILGELHKAADVDTFAERKQQAHTTELARLHNARLVTSEETEKGQYWAESRLKKLTGGNVVTARFMRCDDFEFTPKFKLVIVGNHKPKFKSVDDAIRRRLHLIPFDYKVSKEEKDVNLGEKLKAEYGAILQWAIEGAMEWAQKGLDAPESVLKATSDYLDDEDITGQWMTNRCTLETYGKTNLKDLFDSWKHFCELSGIKAVGTAKDLATELERRLGEGSKSKVKGVTRFKGVTLKSPEEMRAAIGDEEGENAPF